MSPRRAFRGDGDGARWAVYHGIEFVRPWWADVGRSPAQPLERVLLPRGTRRRARVRPRVVEGAGGPVEVADLFFEDGAAARGVPFCCFDFVG
jgi:hypothetical protein